MLKRWGKMYPISRICVSLHILLEVWKRTKVPFGHSFLKIFPSSQESPELTVHLHKGKQKKITKTLYSMLRVILSKLHKNSFLL